MARLAEAGQDREQALVDLLSLANTSEGGIHIPNPLRKLQEQNPEFPKFDQRHDNFLRCLVEVQDQESTVYQLVYETTSLRIAEHGAAR